MASPRNTIISPDSLHTLLQKAHAINTVNRENLDFIQSRKGQQVITKHRYSVQTIPSAAKKLKTNNHVTSTISNSNITHDICTLVDYKSTKNVDDIISSWRYSGVEALTKEKVAIDDFIDRTLVGYNDLIRLHTEYDRLLHQYTRLLADEPECHVAVEGLLRNMEVMQVAIGELHVETLDVADSEKVNDAMTFLKKDLLKAFHSFQSKVPRVKFQFQTQIAEERKEGSIVEFADCTALKCRHTLSEHEEDIWAFETYVVNEETFLVSASGDRKIKVWNLSSNTLVATLTGHSNTIFALVLYVQNGVHMLASGSEDKTIKLWDLSSYTNVQTLSAHTDVISSLNAYEKNGKCFLVSSSFYETIKVWDLDNYTVVAILPGNKYGTIKLSLYTHDERLYLASGGYDKKIKVWSLDDNSLLKTIDAHDPIYSLVVFDIDETKMIASGDCEGRIQLWNLNDHVCIKTIQAHTGAIRTLGTLHCDDKVYLTSASQDKTFKIWNLQNDSIMKTIENDIQITSSKVLMNGDQTCIAIGDRSGHIKLWME